MICEIDSKIELLAFEIGGFYFTHVLGRIVVVVSDLLIRPGFLLLSQTTTQQSYKNEEQ